MGLGKGYYRLFLHAIEKIIAMNNSFPSFRGAELWGRGAFPHLLGIYLVFGNF